jgi:hypothetical protein
VFKLVITLMTMILAPKSFACSVSEPGLGIDWFFSIESFYFFSKRKKKIKTPVVLGEFDDKV